MIHHFIFNGKNFIPCVAHKCEGFYGKLQECERCFLQAEIDMGRERKEAIKVVRLFETPNTKFSGLRITSNECLCYPGRDKVVTVLSKMYMFTGEIVLPRSPRNKHLMSTKGMSQLCSYSGLEAAELTSRMKQFSSFFKSASSGDGHFYLNILLWNRAPHFQDSTGICPDVLLGDWKRWIAQIHDEDHQCLYVIKGHYNHSFDFVVYDKGASV